MDVNCKRNCYFDGNKKHRVFTKGKVYKTIKQDQDRGLLVIDDENEEHSIGKPGKEFFDKHFEAMK